MYSAEYVELQINELKKSGSAKIGTVTVGYIWVKSAYVSEIT